MARLKLSSNKSHRKTYLFNFEKDVKRDSGIYAVGDKIVASPNFVLLTEGDFTTTKNIPKKIYNVNGKTFIYAQNGQVFLEENCLATWTSYYQYASQPVITEVYHNGILSVLITGKDAQGQTVSEIYGIGSVDLPNEIGKLTALVDNVFWTSDGHNLHFSFINCMQSVSQNLCLTNQLFIDLNYGQILDLIPLENRLYIVCKHAILKVIVGAYPIDFKAQRIDTEILNIEENSVVGAGNNILFVSNGKLCIFNGLNIYFKTFFREDEKVEIIDNAGHKDGHYLLPVMHQDGSKNLYCYDVNCGVRYTLKYFTALSKNSGKAYQDEVGKIAIFTTNLSQNPSNFTCFLQSKSLNFNSYKPKNLLGLEGKIAGEENLKIKGDFGEYSIKINNAFSEQINLSSTEFLFEISSDNSKMPLENLRLIYRIQGE